MARMVFRLQQRVKVRVRRIRRVTDDKALANRCTIILLADRQMPEVGGRPFINLRQFTQFNRIGFIVLILRDHLSCPPKMSPG